MPQLPAQEPVEPAFAGDPINAVLHPGESYKIYHARDVLGSVPKEFEHIVERAARWCGVDDGMISAVVERFERRLLWWKKKKDKLKKNLAESEVEDSEEDNG